MNLPPTTMAIAEYNAQLTLTPMLERGLKRPSILTSTCRTIAEITLHKMCVLDKKLTRTLTNRLVAYAYAAEGM